MPALLREVLLPVEDSSQGPDPGRWSSALIFSMKPTLQLWHCVISDVFLIYFCMFVFQPAPIAELDGTVSGDFFTVLCVGQGFTEDQWMNVYSFSMLHHWLLTYHSISNGNSTADTGMTLSLLQGAAFCLLMLERLIPFCHSFEWHGGNITFKVATLKDVINSPEPFPMTYCVFSSSPPANRLQLSLSLSHSFSNGKTQNARGLSLHASSTHFNKIKS